jgi:hypothetical protein
MAKSEDMFADELANKLTIDLHKILSKYDLKVSTHEKILTDITAESYEQKSKDGLILWPTLSFLEQDIVIGHKCQIPESIRLNTFRTTTETTIIPRVIIEVKYIGIASPQIMSASEVAGRIRSVFRNVRCFLLIRADCKKEWILERHGTNFDRIYQLAKCSGNSDPHWPSTIYRKGDFIKHMKNDRKILFVYQKLLRDIGEAISSSRVINS